ncbi:calcium-binding protein [Microvirga sp. CF3062]|uniref:calcium-binding protein n=1 Tax=Microvirga sp. CF3062 TaxID=3110182 RepID=UPI002E7A5872|nr:calcium-binding protein [Microvirga sp. CF3062]MEE1657661.1 calcium-binding protein [Microvirga sp. CF3062]
MTSVVAQAEFLGFHAGRGIYRIDLSQTSLSVLQTISFVDDGIRTGGTGGASGADIDFVSVSDMFCDSVELHPSITRGNSLSAEVAYRPGYLTEWIAGDMPSWNTSNLFGTNPGHYYDSTRSTLGVADGANDASTGTLSLGEGGQLSLMLNSAVPTGADGSAKRYVYFGEYGSQLRDLDGMRVVLSDERTTNPLATLSSAGLTLVGDERSETIAFGRGFNTHIGAGHDIVYGVAGHDKIYTAKGNDRIYGGDDYDWLYGEAGKDRLYGEAGHDRLFGGADNDWLHGGSGRDAFAFNTKLGTSKTDRKVNFDKISDFNVRDDAIWLENKFFTKLGKKGTEANPAQLNKNLFKAGDKAQDSNDYVIYNKKTGVLSYDADGSGSKSAIEFAQIQKNLKVTYKDFFII